MKRFPIFKPGRHTASSGATLDFSEDMLRAAVSAYDPKLHEAPITVGHPKDNAPAYGWIAGMSFNEKTGEIEVDPNQVDADFSEMVQAGRFKKRSASWYLPDAPNNPKPGTLYLRHVAFLGAQPPAVKGLRDVSFAEEEGVVEFVDSARYAWGSIAAIMRGIREWIIGEKGLEFADKVVPNFFLSDVDAAAKEAANAPTQVDNPAGMLAYSEEDPMKIEELQAQVAKLTQERDAALANAKPADFAEREASIAAREAALAASEQAAKRVAVENRVEAIVKAGRLLPAQKKGAIDFAMGLADAEATIDFGEGDKAKKVTQREAYLLQLEAAPKVVNYGEAGTGDEPPAGAGNDPQVFADKVRAKVDDAAKSGKTISFTEAAALVVAESEA